MEIMYTSTRDLSVRVSASQAILKGLSDEGGLFVPESIPVLDVPLDKLAEMDYRSTAMAVMRLFLTDFTQEELSACICGAYDEKFDIPQITTLVKAGSAWYLELFHGKTIAFKDMALSILPYLMKTAAVKNHDEHEIIILTATSGDTGKAALAGFADVPGTRIIVFYPKHGVSAFQEKQMVTQKGDNTCVIGIEGNFDDAQRGVKSIFSDETLRHKMDAAGMAFSSANSINIGRLVPQVVYYVYAYGQLVANGALKAGEPMNVTVPTGNFGNILAAFYAKQMGLPIGKLLCASNENRVLTDFFETGIYDKNRPFVLTSSPSMDILVSSNLERLLFHLASQDDKACAAFMKQLETEGRYTITDRMAEKTKDFYAGSANEEQTAGQIRKIFDSCGYVIDPHTAVASYVYERYLEETNDRTPAVIASTASPFKFAGDVLRSLGKDIEGQDALALADALSVVSGTALPPAVEEVRTAPVRHQTVIASGMMSAEVSKRVFEG